MGKTYRIFTENKGKDKLKEIAGRIFKGFTLYEAEGYWEGEEEPSLIFEIADMGERGIREKVNVFAAIIQRINYQSAVLIQVIKNESYLINEPNRI